MSFSSFSDLLLNDEICMLTYTAVVLFKPVNNHSIYGQMDNPYYAKAKACLRSSHLNSHMSSDRNIRTDFVVSG